MNIIEKTVRQLDAYQRNHRRAGFVYAITKKYGEDEAGYQAALMAYYGFLSLFPLLLVLTTLIRLTFHDDSSVHRSLVNGVTNYFPTIGNDLTHNIHSMGGNGLALLLGLLVTLYGARGVADTFRSTVNHVWETPYVRRPGFPWSLLRSVRMMVVGGIGLILAPVISGYAAAAGRGPLFWLASLTVTLLILFGVFLFLLQASLPSTHKLSELWLAALLAAIGLQILQSLGSLLIARELKHLDVLYGTFAVVLGLLFWLYLQAQVIVYALEAATVRTFRLYPRSVILGQPLAADSHAFHLYTERNRFHDGLDEAPKRIVTG